jgi:hypothetical protein
MLARMPILTKRIGFVPIAKCRVLIKEYILAVQIRNPRCLMMLRLYVSHQSCICVVLLYTGRLGQCILRLVHPHVDYDVLLNQAFLEVA